VMTGAKFREELRKRLSENAEKTLLRIVRGPDFDSPASFTGNELLERSIRLAESLELPERAVVLVLMPHCAELFLLHLGLVLTGRIPAILAWPTSRVDAEKYQRNLVHQLRNLPADALITLPRLANNLSGPLAYRVLGLLTENGAAFEKAFPAGAVGERLDVATEAEGKPAMGEEVLFLQFSGGTTGAQKAIVVTAAMLRHQLGTLGERLQFTSGDSVASWLPMYHDMGLIACLWMALWHGATSVQISANDWVLNPELLLKHIEKQSATFCWLPNFAFSYLSQRRELMRGRYRLDSVRGWISCSEPVRERSVAEFCEAFADWGVAKESVQASYAMAETVFAITQSEIGAGLKTVRREQVAQNGRNYSALAFDLIDEVYVSSGIPIEETEVKIVSEGGATRGEYEAGEICVRTPSLFSGYWGTQGFQAHTLKDNWHATGDYGFVADGELFVIGRFKDIVIVGGSNVFPEDVEAVVNTIEGVHAGRVVAFGVEDRDYGTQSLAVVAEAAEGQEERDFTSLEAAIRKLVLTAIGIAPRHVLVVPDRWVVKSTAGKISRRETRERFLREKLQVRI